MVLTLQQCFRNISDQVTITHENTEINAITSDSRKVANGTLFAALPGTKTNGLSFCQKAQEAGASAILAPHGSQPDTTLPIVYAHDIRLAYAWASAAIKDFPANHMKVVGITGTNGKTTSTYILESIAAAAGLKSGVIGTVSYRINGKEHKAPLTTPQAEVIQDLLSKMKEAGTDIVFCEVSSHALDQKRIAGTTFAAVGFTNLTQDHLDYHNDLEEYFQAKSKLFTDYIQPITPACININSDFGQRMAEASKGKTYSYSTTKEADYCIHNATFSLNGIKATISYNHQSIEITSPLLGSFNLENILLSFAIAHSLQIPIDAIVAGIANCSRVNGRLDSVIVKQNQQPTVLIDYAHTPDALDRALQAVKALHPNKLYCVFGCGGDRDKTKRPIMGATVAQQADVAIITSDNPRSEDPQAIINDIIPGVQETNMPLWNETSAVGYIINPARQEAINLAIQQAHIGDVVLIAGKGHEDYQILKHETIHFSDHEQAHQALCTKLGISND